jgi:succinate dehydrogenase / fumarate reductase iron-sulfur subunit
MNINGGIRQACTALIEEVGILNGDTFEVKLEPMKKFPLIRDLMVDRSKMFENLKKVQAWVPIDGSFDLGMAEKQDDNVRMLRYSLSRCMTCGCCMEACPQVISFCGSSRPRSSPPLQPSPSWKYSRLREIPIPHIR